MEEQTQKANEAVNHPSHYNQYPIEVIDMMERIFGLEATELWCVMTAFKYRMRMGHKDDIQQDMEKEQWYLRRAEELKIKQKDYEQSFYPLKRVGGQEVRAAYSNPVSLDALIKLDAIKKVFESAHEAETIAARIYDVIWGEK